jgi:hypothetical protein
VLAGPFALHEGNSILSRNAVNDESVMGSPAALSGATLPIMVSDGISLSIDEASAFGLNFAQRYADAQPYPHIVLDDFLPAPLAEEICHRFPVDTMPSDTVYEQGYAGLHKRQILPCDCDAFNRDLFAFLNSAPVLKFLENLTGITGLIPDPYFSGGGFHEIARGGLLGVHADFRINQALKLRRRINMLIYLNPGWQPEWGGDLELWDARMKGAVSRISPIFNRCVIFNTDARSFHGHPDPLDCPPDIKRRSIALYYYTASDKIHDETSSLGTVYKSRPGDDIKNRLAVGKLAAENYAIRDWMPPVMYRGLRRLYRLARRPG